MPNISSWISGKLEAARRLPNSRSGNPRWQLKIDGMSYTTEMDQATVISIDFGHRVGESCYVKVNRAGRVVQYVGAKDAEAAEAALDEIGTRIQ